MSWSKLAPDVRIVGMGVSRSMVRPLFPEEDEQARSRWAVKLIPDEDVGKTRAFFADLAVAQDGWTVGLSGWVLLEFRSKKMLKGLGEEKLQGIYGPWAEGATYSFLRHEGEALISRTTGCLLELPAAPPDLEVG